MDWAQNERSIEFEQEPKDQRDIVYEDISTVTGKLPNRTEPPIKTQYLQTDREEHKCWWLSVQNRKLHGPRSSSPCSPCASCPSTALPRLPPSAAPHNCQRSQPEEIVQERHCWYRECRSRTSTCPIDDRIYLQSARVQRKKRRLEVQSKGESAVEGYCPKFFGLLQMVRHGPDTRRWRGTYLNSRIWGSGAWIS